MITAHFFFFYSITVSKIQIIKTTVCVFFHIKYEQHNGPQILDQVSQHHFYIAGVAIYVLALKCCYGFEFITFFSSD